MKLIGLDLATRFGWAIWAPGEPVRYGSVRLPSAPHISIGDRYLRYANWLAQRIKDERPAKVYFEAPWVGPNTHQNTARFLMGLASSTHLICAKAGVITVEANNQTTRKQFLGAANRTMRADKKAAVMSACRLRGWEPKNNDEGDALAVLEYAATQERLKLDWGIPILGGGA